MRDRWGWWLGGNVRFPRYDAARVPGSPFLEALKLVVALVEVAEDRLNVLVELDKVRGEPLRQERVDAEDAREMNGPAGRQRARAERSATPVSLRETLRRGSRRESTAEARTCSSSACTVRMSAPRRRPTPEGARLQRRRAAARPRRRPARRPRGASSPGGRRPSALFVTSSPDDSPRPQPAV